jgi:hypothetical protein
MNSNYFDDELNGMAQSVGAYTFSQAPFRGVHGFSFTYKQLYNFAELVRQKGREDELKEIDDMYDWFQVAREKPNADEIVQTDIDDLFEMDQMIMKVWNITDDIDLLCEVILEKNPTQAEITTSLTGIRNMYQLRFDRLHNHYSKCFQNACELRKLVKGIE